MTTHTQTLTSFLLDRIAEDEAGARNASATSDSYFGDNAADALLGLAESEGAATFALLHFGRYRPARVLAECEAKRAIVEDCAKWERMHEEASEYMTASDPVLLTYKAKRSVATDVLRSLASVYADRPDYREEWRP